MDPDDTEDDPTSDWESSLSVSEFTSISTARLIHSYEHGRRYQGFLQGRYGLPNDDTEQAREAIKHKLYTDYIHEGKLIIAPVGDYPQKIVDLGTGTGLWAQDIAERYPGARIIGTDLTPIQPLWMSPNVEFRVEDLEDEYRPWTNIYAGADLFHLRALLQTVKDPPRVLQRAFENLRPGGWIQCHDILPRAFSDDGTAGDDHPLNALYALIDNRFKGVYGWNIYFPNLTVKALEEAGFINIQEKCTPVPIGRWHSEARKREMGLFCQSLTEDFVYAILAKYEPMGMSESEATALGQELLDAFTNQRVHAQLNFHDCWAQKPLD